MNYTVVLAKEFSASEDHIQNIINLLDEGNTIPFIARYRKEMHGSMDDQKIREVSERLEYYRSLDKRREEVRTLIQTQEKLTDEINKQIDSAQTLSELEDIYRPFRPKRKTRASVAKEKGLEPLAQLIFEQPLSGEPLDMAMDYVSEEKGVETAQDALNGALDIIAESVSDNPEIRKRTKNLIRLYALLKSTATDPDAESVYKQYYEYSEPINKMAGHRLLAVNRGEKEGFLKVSIEMDSQRILTIIYRLLIKNNSPCAEAVKTACDDAYQRLIFPSVEREIRNEMTEAASEAAIKVFGLNLSKLLLQPPVKGKTVIGLDPGFRTGCKVAVVDQTGKVQDTAVIYPTHSEAQVKKSQDTLLKLIDKYNAEVISIGNGTASRETEKFTAEVIAKSDKKVSYMIVNEAGASVYSASKLAAEELPELDLTLRSAASIARRLQDPLAELVKIEPKAIGVGQYQHDMPQKQLSAALDGVVEDCVNTVGADLNTASAVLLSKISGISAALAKNIVEYREENGEFKTRTELKKVKKLGPKAFEQCAGFLRVAESKNPLDNTAVHPESYDSAKKVLELCGLKPSDIKNGGVKTLRKTAEEKGLDNIAREAEIGKPTLLDIITELEKPGRDPRDELDKPLLRSDVLDIKDLKPGMVLKGTVRNVLDFGAFVDIGVHEYGLVHISKMSKKYIKHPGEVVAVGDIIEVTVLSTDIKAGRIALSMIF